MKYLFIGFFLITHSLRKWTHLIWDLHLTLREMFWPGERAWRMKLWWLCVPCAAVGSGGTVQRVTWFFWGWSTFLCSWEVKTCRGGRGSRAVSFFLNQWEILHIVRDTQPARATLRLWPGAWLIAWHKSQRLLSRETGLHIITSSNTNTERHTISWTIRTRMLSAQEFFWNKILNPYFLIWVLFTFCSYLYPLSR